MALETTRNHFHLAIFWFVTSHLFVHHTSANSKSICYTDFEDDVKESKYVDKTLFIAEFLGEIGTKIIITAPRGFGKTANMQMLKAFLSLEVDKNGKKITTSDKNQPVNDTPNYRCFRKTKIFENTPLMEKHFGKYPVIFIDFRSVERFLYLNETHNFFKEILHEMYSEHCYLGKSDKLIDSERNIVRLMCSKDYLKIKINSLFQGVYSLSKFLFKHFDGTKAFVLIDHYDSPIYDCILDLDVPLDVLKYVIEMTQVLLDKKMEHLYVDTLFFTGVSQIEESRIIENNTIKRYEFLNNHRFVPYYGFTENEVADILRRHNNTFDSKILHTVQHNYGGYISWNNIIIHNSWAVLLFLDKEMFDHAWVRNNNIPNLKLLLNLPEVHSKLKRLLKGVPISLHLKKSFSSDDILNLSYLLIEPQGKTHLWYTTLFYSFLFEQGFFTYDPSGNCSVSNTRRYLIPNEEVKEYLWKEVDG